MLVSLGTASWPNYCTCLVLLKAFFFSFYTKFKIFHLWTLVRNFIWKRKETTFLGQKHFNSFHHLVWVQYLILTPWRMELWNKICASYWPQLMGTKYQINFYIYRPIYCIGNYRFCFLRSYDCIFKIL